MATSSSPAAPMSRSRFLTISALLIAVLSPALPALARLRALGRSRWWGLLGCTPGANLLLFAYLAAGRGPGEGRGRACRLRGGGFPVLAPAHLPAVAGCQDLKRAGGSGAGATRHISCARGAPRV